MTDDVIARLRKIQSSHLLIRLDGPTEWRWGQIFLLKNRSRRRLRAAVFLLPREDFLKRNAS